MQRMPSPRRTAPARPTPRTATARAGVTEAPAAEPAAPSSAPGPRGAGGGGVGGGGGAPGPTRCASLRAPARPTRPGDRGLLAPPDPLPPTADRPTAVATVVEGKLWTLTCPFTPSPVSRLSAESRETVALVQGRDGPPSLAIFNPVTPTPEGLAALEAIAAGVAALSGAPPPPISNIFIPSTSPEHWSGAAALAAAFPSARLWAPPGFFSSGPGGGRIGGRLPGLAAVSNALDAAAAAGRAAEVEFAPGAAAASLLGGSVEAALFAGRGGFTEIAFYVPGARTVLTADTAFGLDPADLEATPGANWLDGLLARVAGIHGRLGCATWPVLRANPEAARQYVAVIDGWRASVDGVEWVVPAHLSAPWPGEALEGAFAFVRNGS